MTRFETSDGVTLSYADEGRGGPPVVFIHGWAMTHQFFRYQLGPLASTRRMLAPDLRGCGDSEARAGTHTVDRFAADVHELIEHAGLEDVTLVGWSMGGAIAMQMLLRYGTDNVRGVALIDFPPEFREEPGVAEKVCAKLRADRDAFMSRFFQRMFHEPPRDVDLAWMVAENAKCDTDTACEMYRAMGQGGSADRYDVPALLVFPERGWFRQSVDAWRGRFVRAEVPTFEASRHCPFIEEADRFNAELLRFTEA